MMRIWKRFLQIKKTYDGIFFSLAIRDIKRAANLFKNLYKKSNGEDGFASLEVSPHLAYNTNGTIKQAEQLWKAVGRKNVMIKIPATKEGLPAIRKCISEGININITLLFGLPRYQEVIDAYLSGLEDRVQANKPIHQAALRTPVALPNQAGILGDRRGAADEIALYAVAASIGEERQLLMCFDAFGDDRDVEAVAEADHGLDDGGRLRIARQMHHESTVDLDLVEGKSLQIGQRRIARAEIVHRDAHAERFQPPQQRQAAIKVLDQHAFGDFQLQPAGGEAGFQQDRMHHTDHIAAHELRRRQIDRDLQRHGPGRRFTAGLPQDPFAHLDDQAAFFRKRDEIGRRDETAGRMNPARQRFETGDVGIQRISRWHGLGR